MHGVLSLLWLSRGCNKSCSGYLEKCLTRGEKGEDFCGYLSLKDAYFSHSLGWYFEKARSHTWSEIPLHKTVGTELCQPLLGAWHW